MTCLSRTSINFLPICTKTLVGLPEGQSLTGFRLPPSDNLTCTGRVE
jgi:hypothetical protein